MALPGRSTDASDGDAPRSTHSADAYNFQGQPKASLADLNFLASLHQFSQQAMPSAAGPSEASATFASSFAANQGTHPSQFYADNAFPSISSASDQALQATSTALDSSPNLHAFYEQLQDPRSATTWRFQNEERMAATALQQSETRRMYHAGSTMPHQGWMKDSAAAYADLSTGVALTIPNQVARHSEPALREVGGTTISGEMLSPPRRLSQGAIHQEFFSTNKAFDPSASWGNSTEQQAEEQLPLLSLKFQGASNSQTNISSLGPNFATNAKGVGVARSSVMDQSSKTFLDYASTLGQHVSPSAWGQSPAATSETRVAREGGDGSVRSHAHPPSRGRDGEYGPPHTVTSDDTGSMEVSSRFPNTTAPQSFRHTFGTMSQLQHGMSFGKGAVQCTPNDARSERIALDAQRTRSARSDAPVTPGANASGSIRHAATGSSAAGSSSALGLASDDAASLEPIGATSAEMRLEQLKRRAEAYNEGIMAGAQATGMPIATMGGDEMSRSRSNSSSSEVTAASFNSPKARSSVSEGSGQAAEVASTAAKKKTRKITHDGRFLCPIPGCNKTFSTSGHATRHSHSHTEQRPFVCPHPGCDATFSRRDNSNHHQRVKHHSIIEAKRATDEQMLRFG